MENVSVARRYARALLEAAGPQAEEVLGQLEELVAFLQGNAEVFAALSSPTLSRQQRTAALEGLVGGAGMNPLLVNLLKLLTDRNRFSALPTLARQFRDQVDVRVGRQRGRVVSAVKLGAEQLEAIRRSLEVLTQKSVVLESKTDPALLAGVVAQVGSTTWDGSARSQLCELERSLLGTGPR